MKKIDEKIIAVLLTRNRKDLLQEGLKGLFNQTVPINKILIVDSVSTDGTFETLNDKGILNRSNIKYIKLNDNKGPSGGFAEGIKHAMKENPTWVWILDDDIFPQEACLENLLKFKQISHCIAPYRDKTVPFFNPAIGLSSHNTNLSFNTGKYFVFTNTCCFEGMLINANLIKKIGLPDERFFQVYGDTIYGFVASIYTNIVHVKKAIIVRLLPTKKPLTSKRVYLLIRNHFLVKEYLKKYDLYRPSFFISIFVLMILYYSTIMAFKTLSIRMPFSVVKGLLDGLSGKFGAPR
jgi:rhamnopyranosyl-N-acetylglucosaminyl-diphospho-decaprenol beta-1,3/1,4-galactofuranosyltransferase